MGLHVAAVRQIRRAQWFLISLPMLLEASRDQMSAVCEHWMLPFRSARDHCLRYMGGEVVGGESVKRQLKFCLIVIIVRLELAKAYSLCRVIWDKEARLSRCRDLTR